MSKLVDLAKVLRSKNSGPFEITLDILFSDPAVYTRVKSSHALTRASVAKLYRLRDNEITEFVWFDAGLGLKVTYLRATASGTVGDRDVYGSQQHAPLMAVEIP